jgi:hypothetical protein
MLVGQINSQGLEILTSEFIAGEITKPEFIKMYYEDQIGGLIRNVEFWIQDVFKELLENQQ